MVIKKAITDFEKADMMLIYLYIGEIDRCVRKTAITFGQGFQVAYDETTRNIKIDKTSNTHELWSKNIKSVNLLVGGNGCGKTSVLELLGLKHSDRANIFSLRDERTGIKNGYGWFAIYHITDDYFAVEGENVELLSFGDQIKGYVQNPYTIYFEYDFDAYMPKEGNVDFLQYLKEKNEFPVHKFINYILYQVELNIRWYSSKKKSDSTSIDHIARKYANTVGYKAITDYLFAANHSLDMKNMFKNNHGATIRIDLRELIKTDEKMLSKTTVERDIYDGHYHFVEKFDFLNRKKTMSFKQRFIIGYLETIVRNYVRIESLLLTDEIEKVNNNFFVRDMVALEEYTVRKKYLVKILEIFTQIQLNELHFHSGDEAYALEKKGLNWILLLCDELEKIPENFFHEELYIEIKLNDIKENILSKFMEFYDWIWLRPETQSNCGEYNVLKITFSQLSTGEAQLLDLYASLYSTINVYENILDNSTFIILLDEPDARFHPEWSRQLIKSLKDMLASSLFNRYNYQLIISTHSPLLISDIPNTDIRQLKRNETGVSITTPSYGFMSNLTNILIDTFFVESPFGAFSEEFFNREIQDSIKDIQEKIVTKQIDEADRLIYVLYKNIDIICEDIIKQSLYQKMKMLELQIEETRMIINKNDKNKIKWLEERICTLREEVEDDKS